MQKFASQKTFKIFYLGEESRNKLSNMQGDVSKLKEEFKLFESNSEYKFKSIKENFEFKLEFIEADVKNLNQHRDETIKNHNEIKHFLEVQEKEQKEQMKVIKEQEQKVEASTFTLEQDHLDDIYERIRIDFYQRLDNERHDLSENSLVLQLSEAQYKVQLKQMEDLVMDQVNDMILNEQSKFIDKFDKYITDNVDKKINIERISIQKTFDKVVKDLNIDYLIESLDQKLAIIPFENFKEQCEVKLKGVDKKSKLNEKSLSHLEKFTENLAIAISNIEKKAHEVITNPAVTKQQYDPICLSCGNKTYQK